MISQSAAAATRMLLLTYEELKICLLLLENSKVLASGFIENCVVKCCGSASLWLDFFYYIHGSVRSSLLGVFSISIH